MTKPLPPCPRTDCDADPAWAEHHDHDLATGRGRDMRKRISGGYDGSLTFASCESPSPTHTRCYSAHVPADEQTAADRAEARLFSAFERMASKHRPYLAKAWDEGYEAGFGDGADSERGGRREDRETNPYRKADR